MYDLWCIVGIVFWISVAVFLFVQRVRLVRVLKAQQLEATKRETKLSRMENSSPGPDPTIVRFSAPVSITIPHEAKSIWGLECYGFSMGADVVSFDIEKLKGRYPHHEWIEVDGRWVSTPAELHIGQWRIVPVDFIQ